MPIKFNCPSTVNYTFGVWCLRFVTFHFGWSIPELQTHMSHTTRNHESNRKRFYFSFAFCLSIAICLRCIAFTYLLLLLPSFHSFWPEFRPMGKNVLHRWVDWRSSCAIWPMPNWNKIYMPFCLALEEFFSSSSDAWMQIMAPWDKWARCVSISRALY